MLRLDSFLPISIRRNHRRHRRHPSHGDGGNLLGRRENQQTNFHTLHPPPPVHGLLLIPFDFHCRLLGSVRRARRKFCTGSVGRVANFERKLRDVWKFRATEPVIKARACFLGDASDALAVEIACALVALMGTLDNCK